MPLRPDDTVELFRQVAEDAGAVSCSLSEHTDSTQALLQTFALVESQEVWGLGSGCNKPSRGPESARSPRPAAETKPALTKPYRSTRAQGAEESETPGALGQDSSFEVISLGSRSSSGFCEQWGGGESGPDRLDATHPPAPVPSSAPAASGTVVDSGSCLLDIDSNGDVVIRALEDLNLSASLELPGASTDADRLNLSHTSCDTAELLRTPSPYVVESDPEVAGAEEEDQSLNSRAEEGKGTKSPSQQWNTFSTCHNGQAPQLQRIGDPGGQLPGNTLATSTPKKPLPSSAQQNRTQANSCSEILEGSFEGSCYHRDGTRLGVY